MLDLIADPKFYENKNILITGGTGTFGHQCVKTLLEKFNPNKIIVFSRDEFKQYNMKKLYNNDKMRYFIGDVRDKDRLRIAFQHVDIIFHAAALKQVDTIEYNPFEAVKTNIDGTQNVIEAAIYCNVNYLISISSDKAVAPVNLYGGTKLCLEKLTISANNYVGEHKTKFAVLRYGNVMASRGSVIPLFLEQSKNNKFTVTHPEMTRFTLTIEQAINFVLNCTSIIKGGEIFVPKLPSYNVKQLCEVINPDAEVEIIGIRPGEKIHEYMIGCDEGYKAQEFDTYFILRDDYKDGTIENYNSGENNMIDNHALKTHLNTNT